MPADRPMNATVRKKQMQAEKRKLIIFLITFVVIVFSVGAVFGCAVALTFTANAKSKIVMNTNPTQSAVSSSEDIPLIYDTAQLNLNGCALDTELQVTMLEMCEKYEVPFALALAVAEQESTFNPDAVSTTDDYGLMQINKINFEWLREKGIEPLEHKGNIEAGVMILSESVRKHGDYGLALMAYNCGDTGAKRLWEKGIYSTDYSKATLERFYKWDIITGGV